MTNQSDALHQECQQEIAATDAALAELEALIAKNGEEEVPEAATMVVAPVAAGDWQSELTSLLNERIDMVEAPLERLIETAVAPVAESAAVTSMSIVEGLTEFENELLAELNAAVASADAYARQSSTVDFGGTSRTRTQEASRARSEQNRRAYEKKQPCAKRYEKPSEMTDEERAAHLKDQRAAQREREYAQRKARRAAAKTKTETLL